MPPSRTRHGRTPEEVGEVIDGLLATPNLWDLVNAYFNPDNGFAGATFDTLGEHNPNHITVEDLLAVTLLDVRIPPLAVRGLLESDADPVHRLLVDIDAKTDLWSRNRAEPLQAANELWEWLRRYPDVDTVIAGKLMARKRPRLIPIVDRVVTDTLQSEHGAYWEPLAQILGDPDRPDRLVRLNYLRPDGLSPQVTPLRILDVAVWMLGSLSKRARHARAEHQVDEPAYRRRRA